MFELEYEYMYDRKEYDLECTNQIHNIINNCIVV